MAVGKSPFPVMPPLAGVRLGSAMAGIKKPGRRDVVVIELPESAAVSGVFTRNAFCAAPVTVAKAHIERCRENGQSPRYWLVNTGNANAGTGKQGLQDAYASCKALAEQAGVAEHQVLPFSTGVIGEPLPMERLLAGLALRFIQQPRVARPGSRRARGFSPPIPELKAQALRLT